MSWIAGAIAALVVLALAGPIAFAGWRVEREIFRGRPKPERWRLARGQALFVVAAFAGAVGLLLVIGRL